MGQAETLLPGADVVLRDEAGNIIATTRLGDGTVVPGVQFPDRLRCEFSFTLTDVPDSPFYTIQVAQRGEVPYSREELEAAGWEVALTL
jgi:hypothetical protein